jgi:peptidylprolyl isomerase
MSATDSKPVISIPNTDPPTDLVMHDVVEGTGAVARAGQQVTVHYVGASWSTAEEFDASWDRMEPFAFNLGRQEVIAGWDQGVTGMKIGGRRQLIIPPHLGYGARGAGGVIKGGETLVFVVDLLNIG